jgi:4-hydroxybenzoate polyprenyltransferase
MKLFFQIIRFPNLLIIAFAFLAMKYFVYTPVYLHFNIQITGNNSLAFFLTILCTMLIAASGYISNDLFDTQTDTINKPDKVYIGSKLSKKATLAYALIISFLSLIIAVLLIFGFGQILTGIFLFWALIVSWWYAVRLKKSFVWGNIAVAFMSAGTIPLATITELNSNNLPANISRLIWLITGSVFAFAWLSSLIRELVKDIEDEPGDRLTNCQSVPVVKGIRFTKMMITSLVILMIILLIPAQLWLFRFSRHFAAIWLLLAVEIPAIWVLFKLRRATLQNEYHVVSQLIKWIMVAGILSLVTAQF